MRRIRSLWQATLSRRRSRLTRRLRQLRLADSLTVSAANCWPAYGAPLGSGAMCQCTWTIALLTTEAQIYTAARLEPVARRHGPLGISNAEARRAPSR